MQVVGDNNLCFEAFTLDLRRGCLRREEREIKLRPKSFRLLQFLAANAGRLVSKDDIAGAVWPSVIVTDESLARCVSDVRRALGDTDKRIIKTVPRRGYLFAAAVAPGADALPMPAIADWKPKAASAYESTAGSKTPRLSIVVLPFMNLGGDQAQDYFVDAITESLTTDLSRIQGSFVIARNTAFAYRHKAVDVRQIGRELGVRYLMEGSVHSAAGRVRVHAQLIDAETGAHVWAERFDKPRADILDMQEEITARLARLIGIELVAAEGRRALRDRPNNMDSLDLAMRGWAIWNQPRSSGRARQACTLFEAALRLDEQNVHALIGLAESLTYETLNMLSDHRADQLGAAETAVAKALLLAPNSAEAHYAHGRVLEMLHAHDAALRAYERAVDLNANLATAHARVGMVKLLLGRAEETEAHVAEAMRLSPRDPALDAWHFSLGLAALHLGELDQAQNKLRRCIELNRSFEAPYFFLAAALALAGRESEAADLCAAGRRLAPTFSITKLRGVVRSDNPVFLARRERNVEGMRKAGVPE